MSIYNLIRFLIDMSPLCSVFNQMRWLTMNHISHSDHVIGMLLNQ